MKLLRALRRLLWRYHVAQADWHLGCARLHATEAERLARDDPRQPTLPL
jgi:hypothetical protein